MIDFAEPLAQPPEVQLARAARVELEPESLYAGIALVLRLIEPALRVKDELGHAHGSDGISRGPSSAAAVPVVVARASWARLLTGAAWYARTRGKKTGFSEVNGR